MSSLCQEKKLTSYKRCEKCEVTVEEVRSAAGITNIVLPVGLLTDISYDKWGKAMWYKYPKTMHLPWSPGLQNDDRLIESLDGFIGRNVVVTEKMDGENATLYRDHYHARSLDSRHHPSRDWIKMFHGQIKNDIPEGMRICGENMYAEHSIHYDNLDSYFLGFSIWDGDYCFSWENTLEWFGLLGITPVPTIYEGPWQSAIEAIDVGDREGYVVRVADGFKRHEFQDVVAKYVRKNHIQTDQHWMAKPVTPNKLKAA